MSEHTARTLASLKRAVWRYFRAHRRDFPWRRSLSPYRVFVSEVMLQQTQATRVASLFEQFITQFPNVEVLAAAPLTSVLSAWQGLGYNRRAKFLHLAARRIVEQHKGRVPRGRDELDALPGIGRDTAAAIRVYAFNEPEIFLETNIRTVFIHHCFPRSRRVADASLLPLVKRALDRRRPREWYSALMDYGAFLKRTKGNASVRSVVYVRQAPFAGSAREARGKVLAAVLKQGKVSRAALVSTLGDAARVDAAVASLRADGLVRIARGYVTGT